MRLIVLLVVSIFSSVLYAAPEYEGKVMRLYVNKFQDVLVQIDTPTPNCSNSSWQFQFRSDDVVADKWMSMLLAAKASQLPIRVGYETNSSAYCGVVYFYLK